MADKNFKLGKKASVFVDTDTRKKVLPGQVVAFSNKDRKTSTFKRAKEGGHLKETDAKVTGENVKVEEVVEEVTGTTLTEKEFGKLKVDQKKEYLKETFELDDDDVEEVDDMTGAELNIKFAELSGSDEEEEEEDDEDS